MMSKLHRRGYLAISTIAAASALLVGAPAGVSAAAEEFSEGSTPGGVGVEPSGNSTQPGAPTATEWTPQGIDKGTSSGGGAPLEHGSSVGSGVVTEKAESAGSDSEEPTYTPNSSGSYEPEPSAPATSEDPASTPQAEGGIPTAQPRATETAPATKPSSAADLAAGAAASVGHSGQPRGGDVSSAPPAAAASSTDSGDRASTSTYVLPLLTIVIMLGLILGFAGVRLRRRRQRRRLEALWREQDAVWAAALRRAELGQVAGDSEPSAQRLQGIKVG